MRMSLEQKAIQGRGSSSGFDYLRIGLSFAVVVWHCYAISNFDDSVRLFWAGPWRALPAAILPMFFALSGFLVAGSLARTSIPRFAMLRLLRIVPALAFETILVALVLGPIFTVLPLTAYLSSPGFWSYFYNVTGYIHYTLPGVFNGRMINAQLWTIPSELECYIALVVLAGLGLTRKRGIFTVGLALVIAALTASAVGTGVEGPYAQLGGRVLVFSFLAGVLTHLCQDVLPHDRWLFAASAVLSGLLLSSRETSYLAAFPVAYATVWLGLLNPRRVAFGDLSYGVFLFHFPIVQAIRQCWGEQTSCLQYLAVAMPASIACAAVSWTIIEEPILRRKKVIITRTEAALRGLSRSVLRMRRSLGARA